MLDRKSIVCLLLLGALLSSCFATQLQTGQERAYSEIHSDRQWFTLAGLVQLSEPAGSECSKGASYAKSSQSVTDVLIGIGLAVAGRLAAGTVCTLPASATDSDLTTYALCTGAVSGLVPFLVGSRTVEYQCGAENPSPGVQVPRLAPVPGQRSAPLRKLVGDAVGSFKLTKNRDEATGANLIEFRATFERGLVLKFRVRQDKEKTAETVMVTIVSERRGREQFSEDTSLALVLDEGAAVEIPAKWTIHQLPGGVTHETVAGEINTVAIVQMLSEAISMEVLVGSAKFRLSPQAIRRLQQWAVFIEDAPGMEEPQRAE